MRTRVFLAVAALAVVVAAVLALVASHSTQPNGAPPPVLDDAAARLGVPPVALRGALEDAMIEQLEHDIATGRLSRDKAKALEHRLQLSAGPELRVPPAP